MNYKERLKQYLEEDTIYSEYKSGKCNISDFDKFCIEHCKDIESLLNEVQEYKNVIDKTIEFLESKRVREKAIVDVDVLEGILNEVE